MKTFAALAVAIAFATPAYANKSPQEVCAGLAEVGKAAAMANLKGYQEDAARAIWADSVQKNAAPDYVGVMTELGYREIHAVYKSNVKLEGEGYWIAYNECMGAFQ